MAKKLKLSYVQIQSLVTSAGAIGLDAVTVAAVREALIVQNADLTAGQRLNIELMQAPKPTRLIVAESAKGFDTVNETVLAKGKSALLATDDKEWERMLKESASAFDE
jgi:hypothetical protein